MDSNLALKVNKFIHEQCIDGTPHDIGWNVVKLIEAETQVKLFSQPDVSWQRELLLSFWEWYIKEEDVDNKYTANQMIQAFLASNSE